MDPKTSPSHGGLVVFPPELFRLIIQHLSDDRQALCAISLVCKILQEEGQRQLYRKIISPRGAGIHIEFLKCILDNNRLALLIHEYTQEGIAPHQRGTLLWDYLCRGLQAMVNLKVLKFCALDGQSSAEILSGCTFQLRSLVWGNRDDEGHLSKFLLSQHNLRGLDVDWAEDKQDLISRSCCPQLRVLCGDRGALETFLPGREITSLNWIPQPSFLYSSDSIHSFERLLPYLLRIRFLSFAEYYPRQSECIRSIIRFFPSVEVLKLELLEVFSHDELLAKISMLHLLKELQILVISSISGDVPIPADRRLQTTTSIFESCMKLKKIHLFLDSENYQTYRWKAGSLDIQATLTPWEEVHRWWLV